MRLTPPYIPEGCSCKNRACKGLRPRKMPAPIAPQDMLSSVSVLSSFLMGVSPYFMGSLRVFLPSYPIRQGSNNYHVPNQTSDFSSQFISLQIWIPPAPSWLPSNRLAKPTHPTRRRWFPAVSIRRNSVAPMGPGTKR